MGKTKHNILLRVSVILIFTGLITISGLTVVASSVEGCTPGYISMDGIEFADLIKTEITEDLPPVDPKPLPDTTPPAAITGLTATDVETGATVNLAWDANTNSDFAHYNIYQDTTSISDVTGMTPVNSPITNSSTTTYQTTGLTDGITYYFAVTATDASDNENKTVNDASAIPTAPDTTSPIFAGIESAINAGAGGAIDLSWNTASDPSTPIIYNIYQATSSSGQNFATLTYTTTNLNYQVIGLVDGTSYYFVVRAEDSVGNEDTNTVEKSATPTVPDTTLPNVTSTTLADAVTGVAVTTTIIVQFSEEMNKANTEGAFSTNPATTGTFSWNPTGDKLTYTPTANLDYSTAYEVSITNSATDLAGNPLDGDGDGVQDNPASKDTYKFSFTTEAEPDGTAPATITDLSATASTTSGTTVTLTWNAPGDDGGTGTASTYDVRYSTSVIDTDAKFNSATQCTGESTPKTAGSAESFDVTGLPEGTTCYFAIKTADEIPNWASLSNSPNATPNVAPAMVTDLATGSPTENSITLIWTAPGDDDNTDTASTYDIRYSTAIIDTDAKFNSATQCTGEPPPKSAGGSESFTVTGLSPDTTYYFAIKTADEVPNWSDLSNSPSGTTTGAPDTILPKVISTTPTDTATGITVTTTIIVQFDEEMNKANTEGAFSTNPATTGTFSWNPTGDKLTYTPTANLDYSTAYEVSITNSATDLAGNPLDGDGDGVQDNPASKDTYKFLFTTEGEPDTTGPTVSSVAVDPTTVTAGQTSTLTANVDDSTTGNSNVAATEWSKGASAASPGSGTAMSASDGAFNSPTEGVTATIDTTGWTAGTYKIWVRGKDTSNNWGNAVSTTLTVNEADTTLPTVVSTTPLNGATGAAVTTTIVVQFSEEMNKANTEGAFSTNPSTTGSFSWNGAGDTMTYTPSASLVESTTYTVTITISATDLAGNQLDGDGDGVAEAANKDKYVFLFTTAGGGTVNKYAVVIGIDTYKNFNNLQYCVNDAADWKTLLTGQGYTIHYLTDSQATEANVKNEMQWLASTATANDYVAITFSGHGCNAGDVGLSGTWQGICCYNAASYTEVGIYRDTEMQSDLSGLASTHVFIYFDSCRSGGMTEVATTGRLVQMGCAANGYTYDGDSTQKNGVWTWHTIYYYDNGYTCMEDNFAVAAPAASNWVKTNYPGNTMSPIQSDKYTGSFYL